MPNKLLFRKVGPELLDFAPYLKGQAVIFKTAILTLALLIFLGSFSVANANTCIWIGSDNDAGNSGNWLCNGELRVPQDGDVVIFETPSTLDCDWNINPVLTSFYMINGYTGTVTLSSDLTIEGDLTMNYGNLNAASRNITVGGDWIMSSGLDTPMGDINENGRVEVFDATEILLMAMDSVSLHTCSDINSDGKVDSSDVVLTLRVSEAHRLDPTQPCTGGSFYPGTGSVVLNGIGQTIYGNNTFNNLTKIGNSSDTLYFEAGRTQTIVGNLTLQGYDENNRLSLESTEDGEYWYIDPQGNRNISFAGIRDAYNINFVDLVTTKSQDSGNNAGVSFGGKLCVCREDDFILARVICGDWRQPC